MARRSSDTNPLLFVFLLVFAIGAVIAVVMVPVMWTISELWALVTRKPSGGFDLTDDEFDRARRSLGEWSAASDELDLVETTAVREGCRVRADGLWDERRKIAQELNERKLRASTAQRIADVEHTDALSGPERRFRAWALPRRMAWGLRLVLVSWIGLFWMMPGPLGLGDEAFLQEPLIDLVSMSVPLLGIGGLFGVVGWVIGGLFTSASRPRSGDDLFQDRLSEGGDDLPEVAAHSEAPPPLALVTIALVKHVAAADGHLDDREQAALSKGLEMVLSSVVPDIARRAPALLAAADISPAAVEAHLELAAAQDEDLRRALAGLLWMAAGSDDKRSVAAAARLCARIGVRGEALADARRQGAMLDPTSARHPVLQACVALMKHVAEADGEIDEAERAAMGRTLEMAVSSMVPDIAEQLPRLLRSVPSDTAAVGAHVTLIAEQEADFRSQVAAMLWTVASRGGPREVARATSLCARVGVRGRALDAARQQAALLDQPEEGDLDPERTHAALVVLVLKFVALADGHVDDAEEARIVEIATHALHRSMPGALKYIGWAMDALDADVHQTDELLAEVRAQVDESMRHTLFTLACALLGSKRGRRRQDRLAELQAMLLVDDSAVEECWSNARAYNKERLAIAS